MPVCRLPYQLDRCIISADNTICPNQDEWQSWGWLTEKAQAQRVLDHVTKEAGLDDMKTEDVAEYDVIRDGAFAKMCCKNPSSSLY
jgi:hypothetical protein